MTKSNTLTTTYNGFELIAESILSEINLFAFDDESRAINQATGEENIFYNSDAVYMLGGVIDQLAYSNHRVAIQRVNLDTLTRHKQLHSLKKNETLIHTEVQCNNVHSSKHKHHMIMPTYYTCQ